MIGRLRDVYDSAGAADGAYEDYQAALDAVAEFEGSYEGPAPEEIAAEVDRLNGEIEALDAQLANGSITQDQYDTAVADRRAELDGLAEQQTAYDAYVEELEQLETAAGEAEASYEDALGAEDEALAGVTNPNWELTDEAREVLMDRLEQRLGTPEGEEEVVEDETGEATGDPVEEVVETEILIEPGTEEVAAAE
ncbi:hypothetical protein HKCCE2091_14480 [Rhodobacterales bacterium HKCCE2091]|nr:hypothetical protein [Rhodobacterales bacterium HKCCE2091]